MGKEDSRTNPNTCGDAEDRWKGTLAVVPANCKIDIQILKSKLALPL